MSQLHIPSSLAKSVLTSKQDIQTGKTIGAVITDSSTIQEYEIYGRLKPTNDLTDHSGGYNNFFGYMHPRIVPPNWWAPCFDNKQIRMPVHKF